ncbi:MAG: hypothetical protein HC796_00695 [Synechococcaceae cyanobacterium RL_1_2]|nr:hypothetical protein [Synechococcaceae cyanobacterium RL_1_2]
MEDVRISIEEQLIKIRQSLSPDLGQGDVLTFEFLIVNEIDSNSQDSRGKITIPNKNDAVAGLTGNGEVLKVTYQVIDVDGKVLKEGESTDPANKIVEVIDSNQKIKVFVDVKVGSNDDDSNVSPVNLSLTPETSTCNNNSVDQTVLLKLEPLTDPFGQVVCNGGELPDYDGFQIGFFTPDETGLNPLAPLELTPTELPDDLTNNIPKGIGPNITNDNPFDLLNFDVNGKPRGSFSFLLDDRRNQLDIGDTYLLMVDPPPGSPYEQRVIEIRITGRDEATDPNNTIVSYTARAIDGLPINLIDGDATINGTLTVSKITELEVEDANNQGLSLESINLDLRTCIAQSIQITKTGNKAAAAPGDIVIYRVLVRTLADTSSGMW